MLEIVIKSLDLSIGGYYTAYGLLTVTKFMFRKILFVFLISLSSIPTFAVKTIEINRGHAEAIPFAGNEFSSDDHSSKRIAKDMLHVIKSNLKSSGLFRLVSKDAFIEEKYGVSHKPHFASWRQINAPILLNGNVKSLGEGKFEVSFILWDTISEQQIVSQTYNVPHRLWRKLSHKISDQIYQRVTGDKGYFDTKIVFIAQSGNAKNLTKRLAIMDQDGENRKYLTDGRNIVLTPRFSPKADKILYLSYINDNPRLYLMDLVTGSEKVLGDFKGMSFAPRFSPDGKYVLFSIAKNGSTNIYEMHLATKRMKQLTSGISINTSPTYSPDGSRIVFNSDRGGSRQIYTMNRDGSNVKRLSFGAGSYVTPNWSPRGDYIAYTRVSPDFGFSIGVIRPDGSGDRIITNGYLTESPTWSPNGRVIMFSREERPTKRTSLKSRIYSIDLTGFHEKLLPTGTDASDPEWSRLLD